MNRLLDIYDTQETSMSSNIDSIIEAAKMIEAADKTDLIKEKKIKWVKKTFEEWLEEDGEDQFYIFMKPVVTHYGVWQGHDKLNKAEMDHFDKYVNDYHCYGHPCMVDSMVDGKPHLTDSDMASYWGCKLITLNRHDMQLLKTLL